MMQENRSSLALAAIAGAVAGGAVVAAVMKNQCDNKRYSLADQKKRFASAKAAKNERVLNIEKFFKPEDLKGKRVLVIGGNRGLGLEIVRVLVDSGALTIATTRRPSPDLSKLKCQVIEDVDTTSDESVKRLVQQIHQAVDVLIVSAGYFYGPVEKIDSLNFKEEWKMIDICALGPLRISSALVNSKKIRAGGRLAIITSQAGSVAWREIQNPGGDNYGHHMSRAACNMMGRLLSFELRTKDISVALLHPGFNRTDMTKKYEKIWEEEGAVNPKIGAMRVLHEVNLMKIETTGRFINCEDSLEIPW